jgi:hypothetical protein
MAFAITVCTPSGAQNNIPMTNVLKYLFFKVGCFVLHISIQFQKVVLAIGSFKNLLKMIYMKGFF